jgi:hypothetical protein
VRYARREIDPEHMTEQGTVEAKWETAKTIENPEEFKTATQVRAKCRALITGICVRSDFALLCPNEREAQLEEKIKEARQFAEVFNATATRCQVGVYVLRGRVAQDDAEAMKAIGSEVRGLLDAMEAGIKATNVEQIREAAAKAKDLGRMLNADAQAKVNEAVQAARDIAREVVKRVQKQGEDASAVLATVKLDSINRARFTFLDMDTPAVQVEALPATPRSVEAAPVIEAEHVPEKLPSVTVTIPARRIEV